MADISNLKINDGANVEGRTYESPYDRKQNLYQRANMRIGKIASVAEYRIDEQFQNLIIFGILIIFQIKEKI